MDLVSLLTTTTSKGNPNAYDLSLVESMPGTYDLSDVTITNIDAWYINVITQESSPSAMVWGDNGRYFYLVGTSSDTVRQYLTVTPYILAGMTAYATLNISAQETNPSGLFFKPDGTKMYVSGTSGDDVNEYSLSTAWDVSTASWVQSFSVSAQESAPRQLYFKPDGTKFFIVGTGGDDVNEYSLSTPWDISTSSYVQNFSVQAQSTVPVGLTFKPDGTKMYVSTNGTSASSVTFQYTLSTAWDISSASYDSVSYLAGRNSSIYVYNGLIFDGTGGTILVCYQDTTNSRTIIMQQWAGGSFFKTATQDTSPSGVSLKPDGTKMYVLGNLGDDVLEYDLATAFNASTASYVQNFVMTSQDGSPTGLYFKPDGTKFYMVGTTTDNVYQYSMSTAWDVSTASYDSVSFSVATQEAQPYGLFFSSDGTKMYTAGAVSDAVLEYSLSTAWDISSASYSQSFSFVSDETAPRGLTFSQDGSYMFVIGLAGITDAVRKYTLSTPWDVSTASLSQTLLVVSLMGNMSGINFDPTGTYLYLTDLYADSVLQFQIPST